MADRRGVITVISGFSGTGKGTLMRELMSRYDNYTLSVSMTTREPRAGEVDGRDYFFTTDENFEKMVEEGKFIEHAGYCGHYYGTPRDFVYKRLDEGYDVLLEIEVQGALQVKEKCPDALLLFVTPPSAEELKKRLEGRGTEAPDVIKERLERAKEESKYIDRYDYLLINDDLDRCTEEMHSIIQAAHAAPGRNTELIKTIIDSLYTIH
ncbi:MAG: guanylate kinase [Lachnospiraceae bacterium]|nr:guanylate kinase [Lachnospiraceae bacterium]